jgi:lysyl endopeptidase
MKTTLLVTITLLCLNLGNAQVRTNFNNPDQIGSRGKYSKNFQDKSPFLIAARDTRVLLEREARDQASGVTRPFRIAEPISVDIDVVQEAEWLEENGVAFGKFTILASGAKSISANFDQFYVPVGTELYVYSENGEMITGPITELENNPNNFWGTWVYKGQRLTIDFKVPIEAKSSIKLHISSIAYGYKDIYKTEVGNFGESAGCNVNVLCPLGNSWENERNSVALILDASSSALCSGSLVNNACNLNIPYLLTANHCFATNPQQNVTQWKFTFQAWSPTCNPSQNANGTTFNGSTLRARDAGSDFCLVELNQIPPTNSGITYAGWSRETIGIQNTTIIHHPAGDVMKISRDNDAPVFSTFQGAQCWRLGLDQGATEGGTSGAPYFDQNHRIIAQHFGINDANLPICDRVNKFGGRFDVSWTGGGTNATRLSNWLDPTNTGVMTTNTRGIYSISGPALVCTNGTFTLNNPPGPVMWSVTPSNLVTPSNGSGVVANITKNSNGNATITFNLGCPNGNPSFSFHTGPYSSSDYPITGPSSASCNSYVYYSIPTLAGVTSINWLWPSGWTYVSGQNTPYLALSTNSSSGVVSVGVNNTCGQSGSYYTKYTSITGFCGFSALSVYPNPVSSELTISFIDTAAIDVGASAILELVSPYEVKIFNQYQELVYSARANRKTLKISISHFPDGPYYLNIFNSEGIIQRKIFVSRLNTSSPLD